MKIEITHSSTPHMASDINYWNFTIPVIFYAGIGLLAFYINATIIKRKYARQAEY